MAETLNSNITNGFFTDAAKYTIGIEQGFVNDPDDFGGPTKFGITQQTLSQYRGYSCSVHDVQTLNEGEALAIYFSFYWKPLSINSIDKKPIAIAVFDTGVLYGIRHSILMAQEALAHSWIVSTEFKIDGHMGPKTIAALNNCPSGLFLELINLQILKRIVEIIEKKPSQKKFQNGWVNRANKLLSLKDD